VGVPERAGPGRVVGVSNGKRRVGRAWGRAENNCRAGGDAGAEEGWVDRERGGWGVGFREGVMVELAYAWVGLVGGEGVGFGARGAGRALVGLGGPGGAGRTRAGCAEGGWSASRWRLARIGPVFALVGASVRGGCVRDAE
jgi:hypothetical protein